MEPVEIIDRALEGMRKNGWTRGALQKESGETCLQGALRVYGAEGLMPDWKTTDEGVEARDIVRDVIEELGYRRSTVFYNNCIAKDFSDIEIVLEKARAKASEQVDK